MQFQRFRQRDLRQRAFHLSADEHVVPHSLHYFCKGPKKKKKKKKKKNRTTTTTTKCEICCFKDEINLLSKSRDFLGKISRKIESRSLGRTRETETSKKGGRGLDRPQRWGGRRKEKEQRKKEKKNGEQFQSLRLTTRK